MNMAIDGGCGNDNGPQDIEDIRDMVTNCSDCGALIHLAQEAKHAGWHEKLRRAVDETGNL